MTMRVLVLAGILPFGHAGIGAARLLPLVQAQATGPSTSPPAVLESRPPHAGKCTISGSDKVTVSAVVTTSGLPSALAVTVSSGNDCIDAKALEAVRAYKFRPAMRDGQPVETKINILVNFQRF